MIKSIHVNLTTHDLGYEIRITLHKERQKKSQCSRLKNLISRMKVKKNQFQKKKCRTKKTKLV
jgi:hypothetical protein